MTFGSRSERLTGQALLFTAPPIPAPPKEETTTIAAHQRKRCRGRPALPADLPRVRQNYDLTEEQKASFDRLVRIGKATVSGRASSRPFEASSWVDWRVPQLEF
ncbi:MAG TPA: transposase [Burkholderiaceae bacterium]|nr:transposase [Burkholderiaceae bacterium]